MLPPAQTGLSCGGEVDRPQFPLCLHAVGWTHLPQEAVCPSCRRWWGPLQLRHQIDVSSKGAKENPKGTRSGTQEGVA
jgi:hypothetical protein